MPIEQQFFRGSLTSTLRCLRCGYERARSEPFSDVALGIDGLVGKGLSPTEEPHQRAAGTKGRLAPKGTKGRGARNAGIANNRAKLQCLPRGYAAELLCC